MVLLTLPCESWGSAQPLGGAGERRTRWSKDSESWRIRRISPKVGSHLHWSSIEQRNAKGDPALLRLAFVSCFCCSSLASLVISMPWAHAWVYVSAAAWYSQDFWTEFGKVHFQWKFRRNVHSEALPVDAPVDDTTSEASCASPVTNCSAGSKQYRQNIRRKYKPYRFVAKCLRTRRHLWKRC